MKENGAIFEQAKRWTVLGDFKPILRDFATLSTANFSLAETQMGFETLFPTYLAKLHSEASRNDKQSMLYLRFASRCSPDIFIDKTASKDNAQFLQFLDSPIQNINHPLYSIAREVQTLAPGSARLRSIPQYFFNPEDEAKFQGLTPTILEYVFHTKCLPIPPCARLPLLLRYNPVFSEFVQSNMPLIQRIVGILKGLEENVNVDIKHLPRFASKDRELISMHAEAPVLDWPALLPTARIETSIVPALSENPQLSLDDSQFESITISFGDIVKTFPGATRGRLLNSILPIPGAPEWWSFQNTVNQIVNVATERSIGACADLATDILSLEGIRLEKDERSATLAVHMPIMIMAAYAQTIIPEIKQGLSLRKMKQGENDMNILKEKNSLWDNFQIYES